MSSDLVRGVYTKEMQENVVKRISKYAGATMSRSRNPCITKREAIALADYIRYLEDEIMGYTTDDDMVRVDFFKPSGKWHTAQAVKWTGGSKAGECIHKAFKKSLKDGVGVRFLGMTAVCLEPCHELAHPLMIVWKGE